MVDINLTNPDLLQKQHKTSQIQISSNLFYLFYNHIHIKTFPYFQIHNQTQNTLFNSSILILIIVFNIFSYLNILFYLTIHIFYY